MGLQVNGYKVKTGNIYSQNDSKCIIKDEEYLKEIVVCDVVRVSIHRQNIKSKGFLWLKHFQLSINLDVTFSGNTIIGTTHSKSKYTRKKQELHIFYQYSSTDKEKGKRITKKLFTETGKDFIVVRKIYEKVFLSV